MKTFGVRLAIGAVTVLLGALAAAQAQKDKNTDSSASWDVPSAATSAGTPPAPIAGAGLSAGAKDAPWIAPPPSTDPLQQLTVERQADMLPVADVRNNVRLVQHTDATEPATGAAEGLALPDARAFPESGVAEANPPANETPSLSLPLAGLGPITPSDRVNSPTTGEAPAMSFPLGEQIASDAGTPGVIVDAGQDATTGGIASDAVAAGDLSNQSPGNFGAAPDSGSEQDFGSAQDIGSAQADAMPEVQFEQPPATGFYGDQPSQNPSGPPGASEYPQPVAVGPGAQPANMLRGAGFDPGPTAGDSNGFATNPSLAANPDYRPAVTTPETQFGVAQGAADFGQPVASAAQPFAPNSRAADSSFAPSAQDQPARMANLPAESAITPGFQPQVPGYPSQQPGFQPQRFKQPTAVTRNSVDPSDTIALPGDRRLEGVQSPSIVIQKRAPSEVKVGKPAAFVIHVQNVGAAEALDVNVHDRIPAGMRLVDASPAPVQQGDMLLWQLGAMPAGDERTVTMQLVPEQEGELGSVARVTFEAAASVRTISTRPELKILQSAPEKVLIGQQLEIELEVSNPGTGEATGVMLQEDVPEGLEHPKGRQLDNMIGTLAPGEIRRQVLRMRAVAPGVIQNQIRLVGDDGLAAEHTVAVEVIAPQLQVALTGPSRRFLERQATYQLDIANVGTADASNIEVSVNLDRGFTFVSTDYEGQYDPSRHAVYWSLAKLPPGGRGAVPLTLLPVEEGDQAIRLEARADLGVVAKNERLVSVDSLAELTFQIADAADPIEIGSETTYEIKVNNAGSRNDSNIQVQLQLPTGLELVSSDSEAGTNGRGLIAFQPRSQLAAGGDLVYRVRVRGVAPGTHLVKAIVTSDQATVPVTKEESTMVYADR